MRNIVTDISLPSRVIAANFSVDEKNIEGKTLALDFQDEVKIEKRGCDLIVYVTRSVRDKRGCVDINVLSCGQRILSNEKISISELRDYIMSHPFIFNKEAKQNSIYISQLTLMTGFCGIISAPTLLKGYKLEILERDD